MRRSVVSDLEQRFEARRSPDKARAMSAYMRDQFEFYGIPAQPLRAIEKEVFDAWDAPSERELRAIAFDCWARTEREWQYFACDLIRRYLSLASPRFLAAAKRLITTKSWWDTVDVLAIHVVGPLVTRHPQLVATMDRWVTDDDLWLVRTAILHQVRYRNRTDVERLFGYCEARAGDREFFIRKAIGWALREYSKTDGEAVRNFVAVHDLATLSKREALRRLEAETRRSP